jgi:hypothetical protein
MNRAERRRAARQAERDRKHGEAHGPWCDECNAPMVMRLPSDPCHLHDDQGDSLMAHCCGVEYDHEGVWMTCSLGGECPDPDLPHRLTASCGFFEPCDVCG